MLKYLTKKKINFNKLSKLNCINPKTFKPFDSLIICLLVFDFDIKGSTKKSTSGSYFYFDQPLFLPYFCYNFNLNFFFNLNRKNK